MKKHTLLVCKVCQVSPSQDKHEGRSGGDHLLQHLQALADEIPAGLEIQASGCLWTCDRPCSVTFVCPNKYTYHFVDLSPFASGIALLQFSQRYLSSETGYVLPAQVPELLQSKLLVRVPPVS